MSDSSSPNLEVHAILVHGMGRTPVSMLLLAKRLRAGGITTHLFGYSAAFERWQPCLERLRKFIVTRAGDRRFIMVGHSLGCVLTRGVLPHLDHAPEAAFLLAPPTRASSYAIKLSQWRLFRLLTGEMGQLLARQDFMDSLPMPEIPLHVYAGIKGPRGSWTPFGDEPNDGILSVGEVQLGSLPLHLLPTIHTIIMNSRQVASDIVATVKLP
jgi:hypothetical protein